MEDTIQITLPISGKVVEIRNYTTRKDDQLAERILYAGVVSEKGDTKFPVINATAMIECYVRRLVSTVDGDSNRSQVEKFLDDIHSKDYEEVEKRVVEVVEEHSPKAKEVMSASEKSSSQK